MRRREVDWFLALIFEVPTAAGIFLGAFLTTRIDERITTSIFAAFAITLFLRIFHEKRHAREVFSIERNGVTLTEENDGGEKAKTPSGMSPPSEEEESATAKKIAVDKRVRKEIHKQKSFIHRLASFRPKWRIERETYSYSINIFMLIAVALAIGSLAGMVGCGGGWVKAPVLISGFGVPSLIAISTGMLMTTITLLFTGVIHIIWGQFALWLWTIIAIGSVFGAFIGSALKRRFSSKALQLTMIVTLTAITILLLVKTWLGL